MGFLPEWGGTSTTYPLKSDLPPLEISLGFGLSVKGLREVSPPETLISKPNPYDLSTKRSLEGTRKDYSLRGRRVRKDRHYPVYLTAEVVTGWFGGSETGP